MPLTSERSTRPASRSASHHALAVAGDLHVDVEFDAGELLARQVREPLLERQRRAVVQRLVVVGQQQPSAAVGALWSTSNSIMSTPASSAASEARERVAGGEQGGALVTDPQRARARRTLSLPSPPTMPDRAAVVTGRRRHEIGSEARGAGANSAAGSGAERELARAGVEAELDSCWASGEAIAGSPSIRSRASLPTRPARTASARRAQRQLRCRRRAGALAELGESPDRARRARHTAPARSLDQHHVGAGHPGGAAVLPLSLGQGSAAP